LRRIGKRIVFGLSGEYFVVVHLMVAGRFKDADRGAKLTRRFGLAAFDFDDRAPTPATVALKKNSRRRTSSFFGGGEAREVGEGAGADA
ncbi:MAG: hypothetical protein AAFQ96_10200, partial [Pseudomonadota bacterium]